MYLSPRRTEEVFDMNPHNYPHDPAGPRPQLDKRVRALIADGRRMFRRTPLSERELGLLARAAIIAEAEEGAILEYLQELEP